MFGTNGATEVKMLTPEQAAKLQAGMQPLVSQWKLAQGYVAGFLACAGVSGTQFNIDLNTGAVTLVQPMQTHEKEAEKDAALVE